jgi:ABC-2 type transport system permease protein
VSGFAGVGALTWLAWLRLRARVRHFVLDLRRPRRLALFLLAAGALAFMALAPGRSAARGRGLASNGVNELGAFLLLLPVLSAWTAVRQGVIAFRPEEVHFLFPAPVTSRALLLAHLITTVAKSFTGALMFALFLRPAGAGLLATALGYGLYLLFCVCLQVRIDLACLRWPAAVRRRRARWLLLGMLALFAGAVALARHQDGGIWTGWPVLRHAVLPVLPFATVIGGGALPGSLPYATGLLLVLAIIGALAAQVLRYRGDVREAAHQASLVQARALEAVRTGRAFTDAPRDEVRGTLLPMLPHLRGAGVHAWRQLTVLLRTRKSYAMLLIMTLAAGASTALSGRAEPIASAAVMLGVLVFAGPMFVQCDFRSDYDCLPWLRTLPTPPGVLAAGQLMASAIVLYVLELVFAGWSLAACAPGHRLAWLGAWLALPVFNLLQLSVWNGAHLVAPLRPGLEQGAPGAVAVLRMYLVILAILAVLAAACAIAALFAAAPWFGLPLLGVEDRALRGIAAWAAGFAALCAVTAVTVWCVGRLFVRVDCSRDLSG